jgi:Lrp/AsnC family leucine-responsive transcriptional regulator
MFKLFSGKLKNFDDLDQFPEINEVYRITGTHNIL